MKQGVGQGVEQDDERDEGNDGVGGNGEGEGVDFAVEQVADEGDAIAAPLKPFGLRRLNRLDDTYGFNRGGIRRRRVGISTIIRYIGHVQLPTHDKSKGCLRRAAGNAVLARNDEAIPKHRRKWRRGGNANPRQAATVEMQTNGGWNRHFVLASALN